MKWTGVAQVKEPDVRPGDPVQCDACQTTGVPMEQKVVEPLTMCTDPTVLTLCVDPTACRRRWQAAQ